MFLKKINYKIAKKVAIFINDIIAEKTIIIFKNIKNFIENHTWNKLTKLHNENLNQILLRHLEFCLILSKINKKTLINIIQLILNRLVNVINHKFKIKKLKKFRKNRKDRKINIKDFFLILSLCGRKILQ